MATKQQQQAFRAQIREVGLRVTGPRLSVLAVLAAATTPLMAQIVRARLTAPVLERETYCSSGASAQPVARFDVAVGPAQRSRVTRTVTSLPVASGPA